MPPVPSAQISCRCRAPRLTGDHLHTDAFRRYLRRAGHLPVIVFDFRLAGLTKWAMLCRRPKTLTRWRLRRAVRAIRLAATTFPDGDDRFAEAIEALLRRKW